MIFVVLCRMYSWWLLIKSEYRAGELLFKSEDSSTYGVLSRSNPYFSHQTKYPFSNGAHALTLPILESRLD
jgi:hypothetical protein